MRTLGNIALAVLALAMLSFFGTQVWSLWQGFSSPPEVRGKAPQTVSAYEGMTPQEIGATVLKTQGCLACHELDLQGGILAPSLDNVGVRRADSNGLRRQIVDPEQLYPGTYMPAYDHLGEAELGGLIAYLRTVNADRPSPANTGMAAIEIPKDAQGRPRFTMAHIERGRELFMNQGCVGCHTINGIAQGGIVGPNLTHEAQRGRSDAWQLRHLIDPLAVYGVGEPAGRWPMPSYGNLPEEDLRALVAFLQSLK